VTALQNALGLQGGSFTHHVRMNDPLVSARPLALPLGDNSDWRVRNGVRAEFCRGTL
jgi:hypothetical protein